MYIQQNVNSGFLTWSKNSAEHSTAEKMSIILTHFDAVGDGDCVFRLQTAWISQRTASEWWPGLSGGRLRANRLRRTQTPSGGSSVHTRRSDNTKFTLITARSNGTMLANMHVSSSKSVGILKCPFVRISGSAANTETSQKRFDKWLGHPYCPKYCYI